MERHISIRDLYQRYIKGEVTFEAMDRAVEQQIARNPGGPSIIEAPRRPAAEG